MSYDIILANLNRASEALSCVETPEQAAEIADVAEAARVYAKRVGAALPVINRATSIKLMAERKAGEILAGMVNISKGGDRKSSNTTLLDFSLSDQSGVFAFCVRWAEYAGRKKQ